MTIKDVVREWINEEDAVKDFIRKGSIRDYSTSLASASRTNPILSQWQPRFSDVERDIISGVATEEEIRNSMWSLKPFKAPSPDVLRAGFFQKFWPMVGGSVTEEVKRIFVEREMPDFLNQTQIALILKIQGLETLGNYRPISLCNTVYKVVTKIIVARLRPFLDNLISPLQSAFVPRRKGIDNVIIAQELIHSLGRKKGKVGYLAVKIDLKKAYDKLE